MGGGTLRVRAALEPRGPAGAIVLTDDQVASLGGGKTPPVTLTIKGVTVQARGGRMGGENLLGFSKKLRADLGVESVDGRVEHSTRWSRARRSLHAQKRMTTARTSPPRLWTSAPEVGGFAPGRRTHATASVG